LSCRRAGREYQHGDRVGPDEGPFDHDECRACHGEHHGGPRASHGLSAPHWPRRPTNQSTSSPMNYEKLSFSSFNSSSLSNLSPALSSEPFRSAFEEAGGE